MSDIRALRDCSIRVGSGVTQSSATSSTPPHVAIVPETLRNSALGPAPGGRNGRSGADDRPPLFAAGEPMHARNFRKWAGRTGRHCEILDGRDSGSLPCGHVGEMNDTFGRGIAWLDVD